MLVKLFQLNRAKWILFTEPNCGTETAVSAGFLIWEFPEVRNYDENRALQDFTNAVHVFMTLLRYQNVCQFSKLLS